MAARPPAKAVGDEFAKKYYHVSQNLPDELHRFYSDASKIGRLIGQDGLMLLSTLSDIDGNLNVLSSGGFDSAEVTSITSQDSQGGGVMVVVTGYFAFKETLERRNFTQAFFLSPQEDPKGYFALNDILRFDDQPLLPVPETEINRSQVADDSQSVSEPNDDGLEDVSKISDASVAIQAPHPPAKAVGDEFAKQYFRVLRDFPRRLDKVYQENSQITRPVEGGTMRVYTLSDIDENLNILYSGGYDSAQVTRITSEDSQGGGVLVVVTGYLTLSMRRERDFIQTFFLAPQEAPYHYYVFTDIFNFIDKPEAKDGNVVSGEDSKASILSVDNHGALTEECSTVHVRSIPPDGRNIAAIKDAFEKFGPIKDKGIRIKTPGWNYYYAFVEFEEANAAKRAMKASPVRFAGGKFYVEKPRGQGYRRIHEEEASMLQGGTSEQLGDFDFWVWLKSMEVESVLQGDHRVGDYSQSRVMEEHSKFLEELQRKQDEENQN